MMDRAAFGRTGHESSRVIFGAAALGSMRQERADQVLAILLEFGVNHIDTAASYGDSELRIAPWMAEHRGRFFLATKTSERTGDAARASLERSLTRLGVDSVDLIQLHNLVEPDEWEIAHGPGGAVEALSRARDEGLARFIGVTGHGLRIAGMHLRSLERFDFNSVLLPYNYAVMSDDRYRADVEALLGVCEEPGGSSAGMSPWPMPKRSLEPCVMCLAARASSSTRRATPASSGQPSRPPSPAGRPRQARRWPPTSSATRSSRCSTARRWSGSRRDTGHLTLCLACPR